MSAPVSRSTPPPTPRTQFPIVRRRFCDVPFMALIDPVLSSLPFLTVFFRIWRRRAKRPDVGVGATFGKRDFHARTPHRITTASRLMTDAAGSLSLSLCVGRKTRPDVAARAYVYEMVFFCECVSVCVCVCCLLGQDNGGADAQEEPESPSYPIFGPSVARSLGSCFLPICLSLSFLLSLSLSLSLSLAFLSLRSGVWCATTRRHDHQIRPTGDTDSRPCLLGPRAPATRNKKSTSQQTPKKKPQLEKEIKKRVNDRRPAVGTRTINKNTAADEQIEGDSLPFSIGSTNGRQLPSKVTRPDHGTTAVACSSDIFDLGGPAVTPPPPPPPPPFSWRL